MRPCRSAENSTFATSNGQIDGTSAWSFPLGYSLKQRGQMGLGFVGADSFQDLHRPGMSPAEL
jgi:hypothetical protein